MLDETFFGAVPIATVQIELNEPVETTRLPDGSVIKSSLGAALWRGQAKLSDDRHFDLAAIEARIAKLMRPGQTFLVFDPRLCCPQADPDGTGLGAATPLLHTVDANNREIRVSDLPSGYVLTAGDWIGWQYGSPARYALHRMVTGATASVGGLTPLFEVAPFVRPGFVAGTTPVVLIRPKFKAIMAEASYGAGRPVFSEGPSFSFVQTLR